MMQASQDALLKCCADIMGPFVCKVLLLMP